MVESIEALNQVVVISDIHGGCQMGLCPPDPQPLDGGGSYVPSPVQKKVWKFWRDFWDCWVPTVTRGEPFAVVVNGEAIDNRHHGTTTQISQNREDQKMLAIRILGPIVNMCGIDHFYMLRGTEAHSGKAGEDDEGIARALGARPDEVGNHARFELWLRLGKRGALVHLMHHIGITGSLAYETTALMKEYSEICSEAGRWNLEIPDVVVRSHRHRHAEIKVPTYKGDGTCTVTPGWQLRTPFVWRTGGRLTLPQFGGILIRSGDEETFVRHRVYNISRTREVLA